MPATMDSYYRARYYEIALRDVFSRNPVLQRKVRRGGEIAECATLHVRKGVFWGERAPGTHVPGYDIVASLHYMCGYDIVASLHCTYRAVTLSRACIARAGL